MPKINEKNMKKNYLKKEYKDIIRRNAMLVAMIIFSINLFAASDFQWKKIDVNMQKGTLSSLLQIIEKETGCNIVYLNSVIEKYTNITVNKKAANVEDILDEALKNTELKYSIQNNTITISPIGTKSQVRPQTQAQPVKVTVSGKVIDEKLKKPIAGATIMIIGTNQGAISDKDGNYSVSGSVGQKIEVSFVGMKSQTITIESGMKIVDIIMQSDALAVDDVIVTGIYTRKKESFTGSATTYTSKDLKRIGNSNVLQSLKSLDPSFAIVENNLYGSDPNRLPDIEVRGKTSVIGLTSEYKTDPNQPLFILDGFETKLSVISDLSMDRIENIVVLKDAAATAIYGSKAANGVIVVETKVPAMGKLSINYSGNFGVAFSDLSDYNLMNASEKLEFERLAGYYGDLRPDGGFDDESEATKYNLRKAEIARGVDTYWLNEPIQTAFRHKHDFHIEGGEQKIRYGVGFSYGNNEGVMKGSGREVMNGNIRLIYRTNKIAVSNYLNLDYSLATREKVAFSEFARANPFFRKTDENGEVIKVLEKYTNYDWNSPDYGKDVYVYNPMYNASLGSFDETSIMGFTNNTDIDWSILSELKAKVRFSINKSTTRGTKFKSPDHTDYEEIDRLKRGSYNRKDDSDLNYDGDFSVTYGKLLDEKHMVNAVIGARVTQNSIMSSGYTAEGFIDDVYSNPAFSTGYTEKSKPSYSESTRRSASFYFNGGYSYDNRYMMDVNFRMDGSSVFGASERFTKTWAVGLSWNLHNEKFMKSVNWITLLKLRGSIGNPGNQNFDAYIAMKTYRYNNELQNHFGLSSIIDNLGNKNLEWQKTIDKNIGIDFEVFNRRLMVSFDAFQKNTDPLLVYISMPTSTGTNSVPRNFGRQNGSGYTLTLNAKIMQREEMTWSFNVNGRHLKSKYDKIGNSLDLSNKANRTRNLIRYYDGASSTALWAVPSRGIDPITGREIFTKKDGTQTFLFDYNDEAVVGDSNPILEGVFGTSFFYKGFSLSINLRYKFGGDVFMTPLYNKVENISEVSLKYNQDKRALYDRWKSPGSNAKFKSISLSSTTPESSRFVAEENFISGESISLGYETQAKWLETVGVSSLTFRAYMNDIFRISSIKNERGIEYPFERSISFSIGLRF